MSEAHANPPAEDSLPPPGGGRSLRAAGPVALFWSGYLLILFTVSLLKPHAPPGFGPLLWGALSGLLLVVLTLLFLKREGRGAASAGIRSGRGSLPRLTGGLAAGLVIYGINLLPASLLAGGALQVSWNPAPPSFDAVALAVCTILALSFMEELGFRGWTIRRLHEHFGLWPALLTTSAAFGLCHLLFGWSWMRCN